MSKIRDCIVGCGTRASGNATQVMYVRGLLSLAQDNTVCIGYSKKFCKYSYLVFC